MALVNQNPELWPLLNEFSLLYGGATPIVPWPEILRRLREQNKKTLSEALTRQRNISVV